MLDLAAIKARAEAVTPGPWESDASEIYGPGRVWLAESCRLHDDLSYDSQSDVDAAFIAAARTDVPELVAEVEQLRQQVAVLTAKLESAERMRAASFDRSERLAADLRIANEATLVLTARAAEAERNFRVDL